MVGRIEKKGGALGKLIAFWLVLVFFYAGTNLLFGPLAPLAAIFSVPRALAATNTETFRVTGTTVWTAPPGVTSVIAECWGTGGSSGGSTSGTVGGSGGGGGAYAKTASVAVTPGSPYNVIIGAVGSTGTGAGGPGGDTSFVGNSSQQCLAKGGGGGAANGGTAGAGGLASASTGGTKYDGGSGFSASTLAGTGGGGGGSAGSGLPGNSATNSAGASAVANGGNGGNGAAPRAGGNSPTIQLGGGAGGSSCQSTSKGACATGGGTAAQSGATGALGQVQLTYTIYTVLADTTDPSNVSLNPGDGATMADAFTFQTSLNSDTITAITVSLGAGTAHSGISLVEIASTDGFVSYGSVSDPTSDTATISVSFLVNATPSTYMIRITPKSSVTGGPYTVNAKVTSFTGSNPSAGTDTAGTTITINNSSLGSPVIYSQANQKFKIGQASTVMSPINISDVGGAIGTTNGIYLSIATSSGFNFQWDSSQTSATVNPTTHFGGSSSVTVTYKGNSVVYIPVTTAFTAGDSVTISGLKYTNFAAPAHTGTGAFILSTKGSSATSAATSSDLVTITGIKSAMSTPPNFLSLANGLVGWWAFDGKDIVNNVADKSGSGNTGYLRGFTSTSSGQAVGKIGQALTFNGTATCVDAGQASSLNITGAVSVSAWVKPSASVNSQIAGKQATNGAASLLQYALFTNTGNRLGFQVQNAALGPILSYSSGTNEFPYGKWIHLVGVYDGVQTLTVYINGAYYNSATSAGYGLLNDSGKNFNIGASHGTTICNANYFDGSIDDVRIYNRVLSSSEVGMLSRAGQVKAASALNGPSSLSNGLVGHWTFDGKDMYQNFKDQSVNGYIGYLLGGSTTTVPGKIGQALTTNPAYVEINSPDLGIQSTDTITITGWIYPKDNNLGEIVTDYDQANLLGWYVAVFSSDFYAVNRNNTTWIQTYTSNLTFNKWHHFAAIIYPNGTYPDIYINSKLTNTVNQIGTTPTSLYQGAVNVRIGANGGGTLSQFNGNVDDIRVYRRALSVSEILELYRLGGAKIKQ